MTNLENRLISHLWQGLWKLPFICADRRCVGDQSSRARFRKCSEIDKNFGFPFLEAEVVDANIIGGQNVLCLFVATSC